jgi:2-(1,2-epoxy-1,2-dihydrophenyl)acetyl-CoA isomerase
MTVDPLLTTVQAGVARLHLNRPDVSNSIDLAAAHALDDAVQSVAASTEVRSVLVTAEGPRFCAGGDVRSMVASSTRGSEGSGYIEELAHVLDGALLRLARLPMPVACAVQGAVAGAGLALMLSCDVIIAAPRTKFVMAYSSVGLTPDCGLSWLLPRAIGQQRALAFALTGMTLTAEQAVDWGLVTLTDAAPVERATVLAAQMSAGPAHALGQTRRLLRAAWASSRVETGDDESRTIAFAAETPYAAEALRRFAD